MAIGQILDALDGGSRASSASYPRRAAGSTRGSIVLRDRDFSGLRGGWARIVSAGGARVGRGVAAHDDRGPLEARSGVKRFALYFGIWVPYPIIFSIIFVVNLAAYVVGLLVIDCRFQRDMDALGAT